MPAPRHHEFSTKQLACAYQISSQHAANLVKKYGFDALRDPDHLLGLLLVGRSSTLRTRLACPVARRLVRSRLGALKNIDAKLAEIASLRKLIQLPTP